MVYSRYCAPHQRAQRQILDARRFDGQLRRLVEDHFVVCGVPAQQLVQQRLQTVTLGVQAGAGEVPRQRHLPQQHQPGGVRLAVVAEEMGGLHRLHAAMTGIHAQVRIQAGFGGNSRLHARLQSQRAHLPHHPVRHVGEDTRMPVEHRAHLPAGAHLGQDRRVDFAIGGAPVLAGCVVQAQIDDVGPHGLDHRQRIGIGQAQHDVGVADFRQPAFADMPPELDAAAHNHQPARARRVGRRLALRPMPCDPVAPGPLGAKQRLVGIVDQLCEARHLCIGFADAGAHGEQEAVSEHGHRADQPAQALHHRFRAGGIAVAQQREFVAAATPGQIAFADGLTDPAGQRAQRLVAGGVPMAVVDLLEQVDVQHHRGKRSSRGARAREGGLAQLLQVRVVVEPGQAIVLGLPAIAAALSGGSPQQQDQQQRDRQQQRGTGGEQPLPAACNGHRHFGQRGLGLQQRELLVLEAGVKLHLHVGQLAVAQAAVRRLRRQTLRLHVRQRRCAVASPLRKPGQRLLGLRQRLRRMRAPVVRRSALQQRARPLRCAPQRDQAVGNRQPGAVGAGIETGSAEVGQRTLGQHQRLRMLALACHRLAQAKAGIGDEDLVSGAAANLQLSPAPVLRRRPVPGVLFHHAQRCQRATLGRFVSQASRQLQGISAHLSRPLQLIHRCVQIGGRAGQNRRLHYGLATRLLAFFQQAKRLRPVLQIGGHVDGTGVSAVPQRRGQLLLEQGNQALQRFPLLTRQPLVAQPHELQTLPLIHRERGPVRLQRSDFSIRHGRCGRIRQLLDLKDSGFQILRHIRRRYRSRQGQLHYTGHCAKT